MTAPCRVAGQSAWSERLVSTRSERRTLAHNTSHLLFSSNDCFETGVRWICMLSGLTSQVRESREVEMLFSDLTRGFVPVDGAIISG